MTAIEVDAPNVDVRVRLAVSHHIDNRPAPLDPFTVPHARRPENQRRRGRPLNAATREPS